MKKILLIANSNMSLSGVPVVFMSIVRNFYTQYRFDILIFNDNDMFFEKEFISYGGKIFLFDCQKPKTAFRKIYWFLFKYKREAKKYMKSQIKLWEYDIIHSFQESLSFPFLKKAKQLKIKKRILHFNSPDSAYKSNFSIKSIPYDYYKKISILASTNLIFVSNDSLKFTGKKYKIKKEVIYNTYDNEGNGIVICQTPHLHLLQIGTFSSRKNQLFSLMVLKKLVCKDEKAKLFFIGKEVENGYIEKMNRFIENNNLKQNVVFLPHNYNKEEAFKNTSFLLFPSKKESFGLVLLEAQSCGVHCFSSNTIPNDADMGNIDFLNLVEEDWSNAIFSYYSKHKNARKTPINKEKFQTKAFIKSIERLYN